MYESEQDTYELSPKAERIHLALIALIGDWSPGDPTPADFAEADAYVRALAALGVEVELVKAPGAIGFWFAVVQEIAEGPGGKAWRSPERRAQPGGGDAGKTGKPALH